MPGDTKNTYKAIELPKHQSPSTHSRKPLSKKDLDEIKGTLAELKNIKTQLLKYQPTLFAWLPKKIDFISCCFFYGITKRQKQSQLIQIINNALPTVTGSESEEEAIEAQHQRYQPKIDHDSKNNSSTTPPNSYKVFATKTLEDVAISIRETLRYEIQAKAYNAANRRDPREKSKFYSLFDPRESNAALPTTYRSIRNLFNDYKFSIKYATKNYNNRR
jgi:hypothetical protein